MGCILGNQLADMPLPFDVKILEALSSAPSMTSASEGLGFSPRQFRRIVHDLFNRMGVESARAAVAIAAARGWIDEPPSRLPAETGDARN